eukprot:IDg1282t1
MLRADRGCLDVNERLFHAPARFHKLGTFRDTPELNAFAPWFHPTVGRELGVLAPYLGADEKFPGGLGWTESIVSRLAFVREVCVPSSSFDRRALPRSPEQFGRAMYLVWWLSTLPSGEELPAPIDAWQLRFGEEAEYVRDFLAHRFPAVSQGEACNLAFDSDFLHRRAQLLDSYEQMARTGCFTPGDASEVRYLSTPGVRGIYPAIPEWWLDEVVLLSEYCVQAAVAWLTALYNEFRMFRLSPRLQETFETLPDSIAKALGGMQNLDDL